MKSTSDSLILISKYFKKLEDENYYGTIEVTLQGGKLAFTREVRSRQAHEIAADIFEEVDDDIKARFTKRFIKGKKK
jgi:hypothetical protein